VSPKNKLTHFCGGDITPAGKTPLQSSAASCSSRTPLKILELELVVELGRCAITMRETTEFEFDFPAAWCRSIGMNNSFENVTQTLLFAGKIAYVTFLCAVVRQRRMRDSCGFIALTCR
jgi:hypothetical protein